MPSLEIRVDDLSGALTRALVAEHLADMHDTSPPESVHALDEARLRDRSITFWSAWSGDRVAGIAALKQLDPQRGEVKSMRVADAFRGHGVGRALLRHLLDEARRRGMSSLWLETGTPDAFLPARALYESEGFVPCRPFGDYREDPYSVYLTLTL